VTPSFKQMRSKPEKPETTEKPQKPETTEDPGGAARSRSRSRWWVHLALIASFLVALVPLLLFSVNDRITIHVVIACFFLALVIVHLGQRRHTLARLARQLTAWGSRARRRLDQI
jgi:hypothetical protein